MYDLLLSGGTVLDPSSGLDGRSDIAISDGTIAAIGPGIRSDEARETIDVSGRLVTPGLIDLHAHVFDGVNESGLPPDLCGVHSGVTTVVDAGSAGSATFRAFPRYVMPSAQTEVIPFLNIGRTGLVTLPEITATTDVDLDETLRVVAEHPGLIAGIKVRLVSPALEIFGLEILRLALQAARESGTKLMVHIGDTQQRCDPGIITSVLEMLRPGDIVTHLFTPHPGGVLGPGGRLMPQAREAAEHGAWLDTAHGRRNLSFDVARKILDQGLVPHCISTDLTTATRDDVVFSLVEVMTRFLGFGLGLADVVTMCTANPARALGLEDRLGSLRIGRRADVSVLDVRDGDWIVRDGFGTPLRVRTAIAPVTTLKHGQVFAPSSAPHRWGWGPGPEARPIS